jgi:gas vesicle protein
LIIKNIQPINKGVVTMSDRDEFGAFLVGFIVGGLTGAVVSLLFAPQSGEETRALIKDKSIELRDKASQTAEDALARAEQLAGEARTRADELAKVARSRADELAHEVRERGKNAMDAVRSKTGKKTEGGETPAV